MSQIKLYFDENVPESIAQALILRGYNVLTTNSAKKKGLSDIEQLHFATSEQRVIFTFNTGDFCRLHAQFLKEGKGHEGIIVSIQLNINTIIRGLINISATLKHGDTKDTLIWLSDWIRK